jgi:hypothetical protein
MGLEHHDDVKAWTVDIELRPYLSILMERCQLDPARWESIHANSLDVAKTWEEPLDMVYIDGDHTPAGATADILAWTPHLKFGGIMVFDDYDHGYWGTTESVDDIMFAPDSTWRYVGQVGRMIAFEKGTLYERAPWLTDDMVQYPSHARSRQTDQIDPWLCYGWGVLGNPDEFPRIPRAFGKSPKPYFEDKLP